MNRSRLRSAVGMLLVAGVALSAAACGSGGDGDTGDKVDPNAKVTLVINGLPPDTEAVARKRFQDNVAEFERLNPNIDVDAKEGKMDPQTFQAKLAGGQLEDLFYVYFTDPQSLISKRVVADISGQLKDFPIAQQIRPELMAIFQADGKTYGLPAKNYSLGLLYNRDLFEQAKLDPNNPPKTWEEVRTAAKAISALGKDYVGFGEYSKSNTGGWHFTAHMYSRGGDIAVNEGGTWKAAFNNETGKQVLQQLKDMRWTDNTMGARQSLEWADLLQLMGSGKLGMYLAAPDNVETIVNQFKGDFKTYGLGPVPGGSATLAGGEGYMFRADATPEKINAGIKWLTFWWANPDRYEAEYQYAIDNKNPVGLPEPMLFTGDAKSKQEAALAKLGNLPTDNYAPFASATANIPVKLEPPNAQQIYAVLDVPMLKVLTDKNANIDALLADAEKQVNDILAAVKN